MPKKQRMEGERKRRYGCLLAGADRGSGHAQVLEDAAKAGDFAFIEANNGTFLQAAEEQIAVIADYLSEMRSSKPEAGL
jgi:hypothetical protein